MQQQPDRVPAVPLLHARHLPGLGPGQHLLDGEGCREGDTIQRGEETDRGCEAGGLLVLGRWRDSRRGRRPLLLLLSGEVEEVRRGTWPDSGG